MQARLAAKQQIAQYQSETLPKSAKPTPLESFKGQMNGEV